MLRRGWINFHSLMMLDIHTSHTSYGTNIGISHIMARFDYSILESVLIWLSKIHVEMYQ